MEQVLAFIKGTAKKPPKPKKTDVKPAVGHVVVIGAGPAGLAAARHLQV